MLSGGKTPLPVYQDLASLKIKVRPDVKFFLSDERMVPPDSPDSNQGAIAPLLIKAGASHDQIMRVKTDMPLAMAAADYARTIEQFLRIGGTFPFGLLGIGADGHTASLFTMEDAQNTSERFAIPVKRKVGPDRVSVTAAMLRKIEHIVFLAGGADKKDVLEIMRSAPETIPAGMAARHCKSVEIWFIA